MRMTHTKETQLDALIVMLRKACHAPGCQSLRRCPNMCGCRTKRTFKMNTDTAICWEIADLSVQKRHIEDIEDKIGAYAELSRFHSSNGWQNFFWDIKAIYRDIMFIGDYSHPERQIKSLSNKIKSLKRYPK
jgi:hypothetical protein